MSLFIVGVCCVRCLPRTKTEHSVLEVVSHPFILICVSDVNSCLRLADFRDHLLQTLKRISFFVNTNDVRIGSRLQ